MGFERGRAGMKGMLRREMVLHDIREGVRLSGVLTVTEHVEGVLVYWYVWCQKVVWRM